MTKLLDLLNERKNEKKIPRDALNKFGEILFGDFRNKGEKDTSYERKVFDLLLGFMTAESGKNLDKLFIDNAQYLKDLKEYYPILEPNEKGKVFYRGADMERSKIEKLAEKSDFEKISSDKRLKEYIKFDKKITYSPHAPVQSWTINFEVATEFTGQFGSEKEDAIPVIFKSKLDKDEMLFDFTFLNEVAKKKVLGWKEYEVLRVDKSSVDVEVMVDKVKIKHLLNKKSKSGKLPSGIQIK